MVASAWSTATLSLEQEPQVSLYQDYSRLQSEQVALLLEDLATRQGLTQSQGLLLKTTRTEAGTQILNLRDRKAEAGGRVESWTLNSIISARGWGLEPVRADPQHWFFWWAHMLPYLASYASWPVPNAITQGWWFPLLPYHKSILWLPHVFAEKLSRFLPLTSQSTGSELWPETKAKPLQWLTCILTEPHRTEALLYLNLMLRVIGKAKMRISHTSVPPGVPQRTSCWEKKNAEVGLAKEGIFSHK